MYPCQVTPNLKQALQDKCAAAFKLFQQPASRMAMTNLRGFEETEDPQLTTSPMVKQGKQLPEIRLKKYLEDVLKMEGEDLQQLQVIKRQLRGGYKYSTRTLVQILSWP